ncbi:MAG TPA: GNAT family N-acetyltransferase, partial [Thermopetrobacter sp.]|nr:GNAT family N-acetyltransferase [Thermopetrobacter sp.]
MAHTAREDLAAAATSRRRELEIRLHDRWRPEHDRLAERLGAPGNPFAQALWLRTWYDHVAGRKGMAPLIVQAHEAGAPDPLMILPLVRQRHDGLDVITFADAGLTDYNTPLPHPAFDADPGIMKRLFRQLRRCLPKADLLLLEKMPCQLANGRANPLALLPGVRPANLRGHPVVIEEDWESYWSGLKRKFVKDQARRWRVMGKMGEVTCSFVTDAEEAMELFGVLLHQQRERQRRLGRPYLLDDPVMSGFYARLLREGLADGRVLFSVLWLDDDPVATLIGIAREDHYLMTLPGNNFGDVARAAPGRLLTECTMRELHARGFRVLDFSIGSERYKDDFRAA